MVKIRKLSLALLIAAVILLGAVAGFFVCFYMNSSSDTITLSKAEYGEYLDFTRKYGKAEFLMQYIENEYYIDADEDKLMDGMYYGLFDSLGDKYTTYLSDSEYEQLMISTTGDYSGVGITLSITEDGNFVQATALTEGAPSWDSGIKVGDIIWKVDGVEYDGSQLDICAANVRGPAGTDVTLTVIRGDEILDFTLTRARILSKTVSHEMLDGNIGYINISSFEDPTYNDFISALNELTEGGAKGLVIDIRNNGGGLVDSCRNIADELMNKATLVYTEDHDGKREYYTTEDGRTELPYVLLVNEYSASASEILAAGIQDNAEGTLVGTTTFGKGIIQDVQGLTDGSAVKMTVMQYFSPNGNVIHQVGITPDYVVELTEDCYDDQWNLTDDRQLLKAVDILKKKMR